MTKKQQIFEWLDETRGRWPGIAEATGVNYWWILKFMAGRIKNPGSNQIEALSRQMRKERRAARRRKQVHNDSPPRAAQ